MNLRILMITPKYYPSLGGFERQAHTLSKELVHLGLNVTVVTGKDNRHLPPFEKLDGVSIHRLTSSNSSLFRGLLFVPLLAKFLIANAKKYDVLHLHTFGWYLLGVIPIARILHLPVLLKLPNVGNCGLPGIRKHRFGKLLLKLVKCADAFIAMSQDSKEELLKERILPSRIFSINNGVDTSFFQPSSSVQEKTKLRKKLRLPNGMLCLFSGRLTHQKGLSDLFAIWGDVLENIPSVHLILCGSGEQESELKDLAQSYGIPKSVHFIGNVKNIADYYKATDILVLPSYFEGNSNSILEAMASGLPVVSTLVGGTPFLMGEVGKKYLIKPGDRSALLKIVSNLLIANSERQRIGRELLSRVSKKFSINKIADDYVRSYKSLISKKVEDSTLI